MDSARPIWSVTQTVASNGAPSHPVLTEFGWRPVGQLKPGDRLATPRALPFFGSEPMPEADLLTMFEAARWSQSSGNGQPWRFSYTLRTEPNWQQYSDFLVEGNQAWAKAAPVLVSDVVSAIPFSCPRFSRQSRPLS